MKKLALVGMALALFATTGCADDKGDKDREDPVVVCDDYECTATDPGNPSEEDVDVVASCDAASFTMRCDDWQLVTCEDGKEVKKRSSCDGDSVWYCGFDADNNYIPKKSDCADGQTCVAIERDEILMGKCVLKKDVASDCGDTKVFGACDEENNTLIMCTNDKGTGKLIRIDCGEGDMPRTCGLVNDEYGYDCQLKCEDDNGKEYTDFGMCDGNTLYYCSNSGVLQEPLDCGSAQKCGWSSQGGYDCL